MRAWMPGEAQTSLLLISSPECPDSCNLCLFPQWLCCRRFFFPRCLWQLCAALCGLVPTHLSRSGPLLGSEMGTRHLAVGSLDMLPPSPALRLGVPGPYCPEGQPVRTQSLRPVKPPPLPREAGVSPCLSWTQPGPGWGSVSHPGCREDPQSVTMGPGGLGTYALTLTEGRPLPACWWGPQKGHPSCPGLQCARWKMEKKCFQLITLPSQPAVPVPGRGGNKRPHQNWRDDK